MVQLGMRIFCCWTCSNGKETLGVVVGPFLLVFCLCTRVTLNPKPLLTWAVQGNKDEHRLTMIKNDDATSLKYYTHSFRKPIVKQQRQACQPFVLRSGSGDLANPQLLGVPSDTHCSRIIKHQQHLMHLAKILASSSSSSSFCTNSDEAPKPLNPQVKQT